MAQLLIEEKDIASRLQLLEAANADRKYSPKARSLAVMIENQLNKAKHKVSQEKLDKF